MTIIAFVIDTSTSMNQRVAGGTSLLDVAKNAVDYFLKVRQKDAAPKFRPDRYFLFSYAEGNAGIRVAWPQMDPAVFMTELRNLVAVDLSCPGEALKRAFQTLNSFRLQFNFDTYGQGRTPWFIEPAVVIHLTDGGATTTPFEVTDQLVNSGEDQAWNQLTNEMFRWDQKLWTFLLRIPGTTLQQQNTMSFRMDSHHHTLCESTGGRMNIITSLKSLYTHFDTLSNRIRPSVCVSFEVMTDESGGSGSSSSSGSVSDDMLKLNASLHRSLFVKPNQSKGQPPFTGNWPIPENFWPSGLSTLPTRHAHPIISVSRREVEVTVVEGLSFDKYEVENCALTNYILSQRRHNTCYQVYVSGSARTQSQQRPFGYLKSSSDFTSVSLIVLPYDYQTLNTLLQSLLKVHRGSPPKQWLADFEVFLMSIPPYYLQPLRIALRRLGPATAQLIPDNLESLHKLTYLTWLTRLKGLAKVDCDRMMEIVANRKPATPGLHFKSQGKSEEETGSESSLLGRTSKLLRNPFDIDRGHLLDQLARMKSFFLNPDINGNIGNEDLKHSVSIAEMGDYQVALRARSVLRSLHEEDEDRVPLFGNPFRKMAKNKDSIKVDEAEFEDASENKFTAQAKRAKFERRSPSPSPSPPASPSPPSSPFSHTSQTQTTLQSNLPPITSSPIPTPAIPLATSEQQPPQPSTLPPVALSPASLDIKAACLAELRKNNKTTDALFALLDRLQDPAQKRQVWRDVIEDARKLRKKAVVEQLEVYSQQLVS